MTTLRNVFEKFDEMDSPEVLEVLKKAGLSDVMEVEDKEYYCLTYDRISHSDRECDIYMHFYILTSHYWENYYEATALNYQNYQAWRAVNTGSAKIKVCLNDKDELEVVSYSPNIELADPYRSLIYTDVSESQAGNTSYLYPWKVIKKEEEDLHDYSINLDRDKGHWVKIAVAEMSNRILSTYEGREDQKWFTSAYTLHNGVRKVFYTTINPNQYYGVGWRPEDILSTAQELEMNQKLKDEHYALVKLGIRDGHPMCIERTDIGVYGIIKKIVEINQELLKGATDLPIEFFSVSIANQRGEWPSNPAFNLSSFNGQY